MSQHKVLLQNHLEGGKVDFSQHSITKAVKKAAKAQALKQKAKTLIKVNQEQKALNDEPIFTPREINNLFEEAKRVLEQ